MKKILVFGSQGMAGHVVTEYLKKNTDWEIHTVSRHQIADSNHYKVDVREIEKLDKVLSKCYDVVLNFVGILNQYAESNPEEAIYVNAYFPHYIAKKSQEFGHRLIHLSTDCVFSGYRGQYIENDVKDATGYYAKSKALGEVDYDIHLTCRTSIIGPERKTNGIGLFHWFAQQIGEIKGYKNAIWTGVTTVELAKAIQSFILSDVKGIYHLVNNDVISKLDLLKLFHKFYKYTKVSSINVFEEYYSDKSLVNTRTDYLFQVPSYEQMVEEMIYWMEEYPEIYPHYLK